MKCSFGIVSDYIVFDSDTFVNTFVIVNGKTLFNAVAKILKDGYNGSERRKFAMRIESRLSHILGARRLKMSEVARQTGIGKSTLLRLYHDRAEGIRFDVLAKLCKALDCEPGDILAFVDGEKDH
ncbi:MAG: helix-turn-helix domain-containing protein [Moorellaceae bacterium]